MDSASHLRERDWERIQALRIFDDEFLGLVFEDNFEGTELLLNIVLGRGDAEHKIALMHSGVGGTSLR
ncbi:MAG: hypothetical protein LJU34_08065 [Oscillospiraceae bacterium]|nr:hypothetical protein [Oscillospiraceae bacterium]